MFFAHVQHNFIFLNGNPYCELINFIQAILIYHNMYSKPKIGQIRAKFN